LRPVLADWRLPPADISLVFPTRSPLAAKTRALVDFLLDVFEPQRRAANGTAGGWSVG
jgi:hypothetical protein